MRRTDLRRPDTRGITIEGYGFSAVKLHAINIFGPSNQDRMVAFLSLDFS